MLASLAYTCNTSDQVVHARCSWLFVHTHTVCGTGVPVALQLFDAHVQ